MIGRWRRGTVTPSSRLAAPRRREGSALPREDFSWSLGLLCQRCPQGSRRWTECCRQCEGSAERWEPLAVTIIGLHCLLLRKLLPLLLELNLGSLQVHLLGLQACRLLLDVLRVAVGTLVWRHDLGGVINVVVAVVVEAPAGWRVVVNPSGVVLWAIPREDLKESAQRGRQSPLR